MDNTKQLKLRDDYIKLGQALKAAGVAGTGVDAKLMILDGEILVNGQTALERGKKLYEGDKVTYQEKGTSCHILITK